MCGEDGHTKYAFKDLFSTVGRSDLGLTHNLAFQQFLISSFSALSLENSGMLLCTRGAQMSTASQQKMPLWWLYYYLPHPVAFSSGQFPDKPCEILAPRLLSLTFP